MDHLDAIFSSQNEDTPTGSYQERRKGGRGVVKFMLGVLAAGTVGLIAGGFQAKPHTDAANAAKIELTSRDAYIRYAATHPAPKPPVGLMPQLVALEQPEDLLPVPDFRGPNELQSTISAQEALALRDVAAWTIIFAAVGGALTINHLGIQAKRRSNGPHDPTDESAHSYTPHAAHYANGVYQVWQEIPTHDVSLRPQGISSYGYAYSGTVYGQPVRGVPETAALHNIFDEDINYYGRHAMRPTVDLDFSGAVSYA